MPSPPPSPPLFDHEKLLVYRSSIAFVAWCEDLMQSRQLAGELRSQLARAATSIPLNIAEGNGKTFPRDRCRYLETARGSALECAACLDVLTATGRLAQQDAIRGKENLREIVSMLTGLIAAVADRAGESEGEYRAGTEEGDEG